MKKHYRYIGPKILQVLRGIIPHPQSSFCLSCDHWLLTLVPRISGFCAPTSGYIKLFGERNILRSSCCLRVYHTLRDQWKMRKWRHQVCSVIIYFSVTNYCRCQLSSCENISHDKFRSNTYHADNFLSRSRLDLVSNVVIKTGEFPIKITIDEKDLKHHCIPYLW